MSDQWLDWAKRIQALSQAGLAFTKDKFDVERYEELRELSAEIMAAYSDVEIEKVENLFTNETGYPTPKVDVRGVVFRGDKLLLVKEKHDDKWALPGGFCEIGFSPSENAVKEIEEEAGFATVAKKMLAVFDMQRHSAIPQPYHYYKLFILCEIIGGTAETGIETSEVEFFAADQLPVLSEKRNTASQIQQLFTFLQHPNQPPLFD